MFSSLALDWLPLSLNLTDASIVSCFRLSVQHCNIMYCRSCHLEVRLEYCEQKPSSGENHDIFIFCFKFYICIYNKSVTMSPTISECHRFSHRLMSSYVYTDIYQVGIL